jgi:hypothetical protein
VSWRDEAFCELILGNFVPRRGFSKSSKSPAGFAQSAAFFKKVR